MKRSTLLLALALLLVVASPAFASLDDDKSFLSHKLDLHKKFHKIRTGATGATGPKRFFHHWKGRKLMSADGDGVASADFLSHKDRLKKMLPTGHWNVHSRTHQVEADSLFQQKLDKLKKLLPTGAWAWDAKHEDVKGHFFLPKHKLDQLKKLLPTGHWTWDSEADALATTDEKTFMLHKFGKKSPTGPKTGPWWRH